MSNDYKPLQGMSDIFGNDAYLFREIENTAHRIFNNYGYSEVRTPILEKSDIFLHTLGGTSDIVQKEMYNFQDRGGRSIVLRPEGTAGVVRFLASKGETGLNDKVYYLGPMFRCERPQAGRKRQFHQIGVEQTSNPNPLIDAEVIALQCELLHQWGVENIRIKINSLGSLDDQANIRLGLLKSLEPYQNNLTEEEIERIHKNVLRFLDSKDEKYKKIINELPSIQSFMSDESKEYLEKVINILKSLDIEVECDQNLVRGLDYYNHTVWEITHDSLGSQNALAGGGRYTINIGKRKIDGVGFGMGVERILSAKQNAKNDINNEVKQGYWIISLGSTAILENMKLAKMLRNRGAKVGMDLEEKSMKSQLRRADRFNASKVIIRGDNELNNDIVIIKDLENHSQEELPLENFIESI